MATSLTSVPEHGIGETRSDGITKSPKHLAFRGISSANRKLCGCSREISFTLTTPSIESMNAGRPTRREYDLGGAGLGDRQTRGELRPSTPARGVSTCDSFLRSRESPQP